MFLSPVKCALLIVAVASVSLIIFTDANAEIEEIPEWVKQNAGWWAEGLITDQEYISGSAYLWSHDIIPNTKETTPCDKVDKVLDSQITAFGAIIAIEASGLVVAIDAGSIEDNAQQLKYLLEIYNDNMLIIEEMFDDIKYNPELYDSCTNFDSVNSVHYSRYMQQFLSSAELIEAMFDHLDAMSDS